MSISKWAFGIAPIPDSIFLHSSGGLLLYIPYGFFVGLRDRLQNLKESVSQWTEDVSGNSPDRKLETNLVEMERGSEIARTPTVKAIVIKAPIGE